MPTLHWLTRDEDIGAGSALTSQTRLRGDCGTMARAIEPLMPSPKPRWISFNIAQIRSRERQERTKEDKY